MFSFYNQLLPQVIVMVRQIRNLSELSVLPSDSLSEGELKPIPRLPGQGSFNALCPWEKYSLGKAVNGLGWSLDGPDSEKGKRYVELLPAVLSDILSSFSEPWSQKHFQRGNWRTEWLRVKPDEG